MSAAGPEIQQAMAAGNAAYEAKFGRVYLVLGRGAAAPSSCWPGCSAGSTTTRRPSAGSSGASSAKINRLRLQRLLSRRHRDDAT